MTQQSIRDIAAQVRSGALPARRLAEHAIRRHQTLDLGAFIVFDPEGALAQADAIDAAVARGHDPGPLAGITVSVKDLYGIEHLPTRAGTRRPLPARWQREGPLVRALRSLGAVVTGKTHTVELAFGGVGLNPNTGTPVNPWDGARHRVPGGSSAGAGVSLWEESALIALGTDTGGSVRIPAAATGTFGHRHTTGRWPTDGAVPLSTTLDTVGLLTRTAADSRHVFSLLDPLLAPGAQRTAPPGAADPPGAAPPSPGPDPAHPDPARRVAGLRIGLPRSKLWTRSAPDVAAAVSGALAELEAAGARVFEVDAPELDEAGAAYLSGELVQPERFESLERDMPGWLGILDPTVGKRLESAPKVSAVSYVAVLRLRRRLARSIRDRFKAQQIDLLAAPTLPITPPPVSDLADLDVYRAVNHDMLSGTGPASMLDLCAVSIPAGLDGHGIPAGLHLMGASGSDRLLLDRACAVEAVLGTAAERLGTPPRISPRP